MSETEKYTGAVLLLRDTTTHSMLATMTSVRGASIHMEGRYGNNYPANTA